MPDRARGRQDVGKRTHPAHAVAGGTSPISPASSRGAGAQMTTSFHWPAPLLGRFVRLEPIRPDHLDGLIASGLDPGLYEWTVDRVDSPAAMALGIESALEAMAAGREVVYATLKSSTGQVVGTTRFLNIDRTHRRVEIGGTRVGLAWQRTPINTEAKLLMLRHAFEDWGMNRVEFKTDAPQYSIAGGDRSAGRGRGGNAPAPHDRAGGTSPRLGLLRHHRSRLARGPRPARQAARPAVGGLRRLSEAGERSVLILVNSLDSLAPRPRFAVEPTRW